MALLDASKGLIVAEALGAFEAQLSAVASAVVAEISFAVRVVVAVLA